MAAPSRSATPWSSTAVRRCSSRREIVHNASVVSLVFTLALAYAGPFGLIEQDSPRGTSMGNKITIRIGNEVFGATLSHNPTAAAFTKLLPLSIVMTELNRNEKFARL